MISSKVCLILGAGASKPYGYPLGWELKQRIIQYCLSQPPYCAPPEKCSETWDKLERFARRFDHDDSATIDAFLETLPKDDELGRHGRMAIVAVLSTYEHKYDERAEWYDKIFAFLESKTDSASLKVVTFNYDRSLEFFLSRSIEKNGQSSPQVARERFQQVVEIEHVYGCFANLPNFPGKAAVSVEYASLTGHDLWKGGLERIQVIGEAMPEGEHICRSKQWIAESDYIVVLGFGFDHTNLNLIGLDNLPVGKFVFSSGFKLGGETRSRVRWSCTPTKFHFASENARIVTFLESSRLLISAAGGEPVGDVYRELGPGAP